MRWLLPDQVFASFDPFIRIVYVSANGRFGTLNSIDIVQVPRDQSEKLLFWIAADVVSGTGQATPWRLTQRFAIEDIATYEESDKVTVRANWGATTANVRRLCWRGSWLIGGLEGTPPESLTSHVRLPVPLNKAFTVHSYIWKTDNSRTWMTYDSAGLFLDNAHLESGIMTWFFHGKGVGIHRITVFTTDNVAGTIYQVNVRTDST